MPSPQVKVPKQAPPTTDVEDSEDSQTIRMPKKEEDSSTIHVPKKDDDSTIRVLKKKPNARNNESDERTELEEDRPIPVRAPLEPTGGKNLVGTFLFPTITMKD